MVIAYLHDTVEDTDVTVTAIEEEFGALVSSCVDLLTDEAGANRKERKAKTYANLATVRGPNELALVVKAADRLANVRACIADGRESLWRLYREEHPVFRQAAYRIGLCDSLWIELDLLLSERDFDGLGRRATMQNYYAARATEYDKVYAKPERQADLRQMECWLPSVLAGRSVLEVACGTGYWTQFFAPHCTRVVAVDSAEETIQVAKSRVLPQTVEFVVGDAYSLPPQPSRLSAGFAGFWWSHIPRARVAEFLRGLHAALEPGATVVFLDNRFVPGSSTPITEQDAEGNTYQTRLLSDGTAHRVLKNFPSERDLVAAVSPFAAWQRYHEWEYFWALEYATSP